MSFHLKELERAGLIEARREARSIIYSADFAGLRDLIAFLMKDCCAGRPENLCPGAGRSVLFPCKIKEARPCLSLPLTFYFSAPETPRGSIIGEAILNKVGAGRFHGYSAGSQPKGQVNPNSIASCASSVTTPRAFARNHGMNSSNPGRLGSTLCSRSATARRRILSGVVRHAHDGALGPARSRRGDRQSG